MGATGPAGQSAGYGSDDAWVPTTHGSTDHGPTGERLRDLDLTTHGFTEEDIREIHALDPGRRSEQAWSIEQHLASYDQWLRELERGGPHTWDEWTSVLGRRDRIDRCFDWIPPRLLRQMSALVDEMDERFLRVTVVAGTLLKDPSSGWWRARVPKSNLFRIYNRRMTLDPRQLRDPES